jgi:hypothetical protein
LGVVQPHDNRFVSGKLDGARVHAQEPECASDQLGKGSASVAIYPKLFQPLSLEMFYGTSDRDSSSRSQQRPPKSYGVSPAAYPGAETFTVGVT